MWVPVSFGGASTVFCINYAIGACPELLKVYDKEIRNAYHINVMSFDVLAAIKKLLKGNMMIFYRNLILTMESNFLLGIRFYLTSKWNLTINLFKTSL